MAEKTPVGNMPRMVPDRDDIRLRTNSQPERKSPSAKTPPAAKPARAGTSWVMVTLMIVSGVAIGYLALQQYSLTQLLNSYDERLQLADERIVALERSMTETDESVAMNGTAINAQFKAIKTETDLHMSEIRKLWDVTNKRNRQWIEENQAALKKQTESVTALQTNLNTLQTTLKSLQTAQNSDEQMFTNLSGELSTSQSALSELDASLQTTVEELASISQSVESLQQANVEERILTLTLTQENLLSEQGVIDGKVGSNGQSIGDIQENLKAVDAYRLETSKRLSALVSQLEHLDARVTALTGTTTAQ